MCSSTPAAQLVEQIDWKRLFSFLLRQRRTVLASSSAFSRVTDEFSLLSSDETIPPSVEAFVGSLHHWRRDSAYASGWRRWLPWNWELFRRPNAFASLDKTIAACMEMLDQPSGTFVGDGLLRERAALFEQLQQNLNDLSPAKRARFHPRARSALQQLSTGLAGLFQLMVTKLLRGNPVSAAGSSAQGAQPPRPEVAAERAPQPTSEPTKPKKDRPFSFQSGVGNFGGLWVVPKPEPSAGVLFSRLNVGIRFSLDEMERLCSLLNDEMGAANLLHHLSQSSKNNGYQFPSGFDVVELDAAIARLTHAHQRCDAREQEFELLEDWYRTHPDASGDLLQAKNQEKEDCLKILKDLRTDFRQQWQAMLGRTWRLSVLSLRAGDTAEPLLAEPTDESMLVARLQFFFEAVRATSLPVIQLLWMWQELMANCGRVAAASGQRDRGADEVLFQLALLFEKCSITQAHLDIFRAWDDHSQFADIRFSAGQINYFFTTLLGLTASRLKEAQRLEEGAQPGVAPGLKK